MLIYSLFVSIISKFLKSCSSEEVIKFKVISAIFDAVKGVLIFVSHNEISFISSFAFIFKNILLFFRIFSVGIIILKFLVALEKINCSVSLNTGDIDKI